MALATALFTIKLSSICFLGRFSEAPWSVWCRRHVDGIYVIMYYAKRELLNNDNTRITCLFLSVCYLVLRCPKKENLRAIHVPFRPDFLEHGSRTSHSHSIGRRSKYLVSHSVPVLDFFTKSSKRTRSDAFRSKLPLRNGVLGRTCVALNAPSSRLRYVRQTYVHTETFSCNCFLA